MSPRRPVRKPGATRPGNVRRASSSLNNPADYRENTSQRESASARSVAMNRSAIGGNRQRGEEPMRTAHTPGKEGDSPRKILRGRRLPWKRHRAPAAVTSRKAEKPASSSRFSRKFTISFTDGEKTRQFSLRALSVIFFALLAVVIIAHPLSQYLDQQQQKREALASLEKTTDRVASLEKEIARWNDPAFVRSQARERLGYVLPGETLYLVSDPAKGTADQIIAERAKEVNDRRRQATPYYLTMWESIEIAGNSAGAVNPSNVPLIQPDSEKSEQNSPQPAPTPAQPQEAEPENSPAPASPDSAG
ncbi:FtsB family cell division protein [Trueperella sp. LYQ141]|uniref:FtsB family cell division protein n=1 Tax=Trueperella sp. LYQ141 TaxID=3391058 RepID=UPI003982FD5A